METRTAAVAMTAMILLSTDVALADAPVKGPLEPTTSILSDAGGAGVTETALAGEHARIDLARDLLLDEKYDEASLQLQAILEDKTSAAARDRVEILLGRIDIERGLGERALSHLDTVADEAVAAPIYLVFLKARAAAMAGQDNRALTLYRQVIDVAPETLILHRARLELPEILVRLDLHKEAEASYADLLQRYPELPTRPRAMYRQAQLLLTLGQDERGADLMHKVWWNYPWKEEGVKARLVLQAGKLMGMKVPETTRAQELERATLLRKAKHWREAEEALEELLKELPSNHHAMQNEARLQRALTAYDMQDYATALPLLQALTKVALDPRQRAGLNTDMVMKTLQRCQHRMGDSKSAEATLNQRLTRKSPRESNQLKARFFWEDGRYKEAKKYRDRTLRPRDRQDWDYAFLLYKTGQYKNAERLLSTLLTDKKNRGKIPHKQLLYWIGRARERQNRAEGARQIYRRVIEDHPRTFYAHLASSRIQEMDEGLEKMVSTARQGRVYWSGAGAQPELGSTDILAREEMSDYVTTRPLGGAMRRAAQSHGDLWEALNVSAFLYDVGMKWDALFELRKATMEFRGLDAAFSKGATPTATRPIALTRYKRWGHLVDNRRTERLGYWGLKAKTLRYPVPQDRAAKEALSRHQLEIKAQRKAIKAALRAAMMEAGDHHFVRRMRLSTGGWSRTDPGEEAARDMWTEVFPRAFARTVFRHAKREGLNPYLLWAIMTVESGYNPDTISYADARGLLQVIPKTGNKVAATLGENNFGPYDLMHPVTSIRHGAWYFRQLVNKFKGQEPLAIASYNGGPHNVQRWLLHKDHIPLDEFVEEIPFSQARRYTKRVLKYLGVFLRIYEGSEGLYLGQSLNGDILVEPRY